MFLSPPAMARFAPGTYNCWSKWVWGRRATVRVACADCAATRGRRCAVSDWRSGGEGHMRLHGRAANHSAQSWQSPLLGAGFCARYRRRREAIELDGGRCRRPCETRLSGLGWTGPQQTVRRPDVGVGQRSKANRLRDRNGSGADQGSGVVAAMREPAYFARHDRRRVRAPNVDKI